MESNKKNNEETKNKNRDAQKKRSSHKAVESVLRPGRESMVGKICEKGRYIRSVMTVVFN